MNILYITEYDPTTCSCGAEIRNKIVYDLLVSSGHIVYTICIAYRLQDEYFDSERNIIWVCFNKRWTIKWFIYSLCKIFAPAVKLPHIYHAKDVVRTTWKDVSFDAVVVSYLTNCAFTSAWEIAPVVLDADDFPSECFESALKKVNWLNRLQVKILKYYETYIIHRCKVIWVCNKDHFKKIKHKDCLYFPNFAAQILPPTPKQTVTEKRDDYLFSVGLLSHAPNYEGIDFFISKFWPRIIRKYPLMKYKIAGKGLPDNILEKWKKVKGVEPLGFVDDLVAYYQNCLASVVPIFSGSGTCIKVIEALQHGCYCIATETGLRGVPSEYWKPENGFFLLADDTDILKTIDFIKGREPEFAQDRKHIQNFGQTFWDRSSLPDLLATTLDIVTRD